MKNGKWTMDTGRAPNPESRIPLRACAALVAMFAAVALSAPAGFVVTNLTAENWQTVIRQAVSEFGQAANRNDRQAYLDALDKVLYLSTNCPGMSPEKKLVQLGNYGYDIALSMERHGEAVGWRKQQRLDLLKTVSEHNEQPARRFKAAFELAKFRCLTCPDAELPKAEEALRALFLDPKQDPVSRLEVLQRMYAEPLTFNLDVLDIAAKVKAQSEDPAVHLKYYTAMNEYMSDMYGGWAWGQEQNGHDPLNPAYSYESRLVFTDKGIADPKVANKLPLHYHKAWLLDRMERWDEAEQIYLSMTTNTNLRDRADAYCNYARFMEGRAKRFYTPDWQPYLKQAMAAYQQAMALNVDPRTPGNWGFRQSAVDCAIQAKDFGAARSAIADIVAHSKGQTNNFCRIRLGRIAWAEGDWEGVVANYPGIDADVHPYDGYDISDRVKIAKALKRLGREQELLAALQVLSKRAKGKWQSYYQFAYDRLKAKLDAGR